MCDGHLGLIHLYADLKSVGTGGKALADELLNITVELGNKVEETPGQLVFLVERHNKPVGLVDVVERVLHNVVGRMCHHLLVDVGNAVGRGDGSTQVDGLSDHDRQAHHVAVVGAEGTPDVRSHTVEGVGQLRHALRGHLSEGLCLLRRDEALLRQARDGLRQASAHSVHQIGA